jgi:V/A-type H+-transporting ATPase subunit D
MARYSIPPTKTNLMRLRRDHAFAREGHELLEQKREILVNELMAIMDRAKQIQAETDEAFQKAYDALIKAVVRMGRRKVESASDAINIKSNLRLSERRIMGVIVPVINATFDDNPPYYSPGETSFWLDEAIQNFRDILKMIGKLAEMFISVMNLTQEVKKTVRRVNALEKIALPDYQETIKYIEESLEESERETFFTLKLVKARLEKKRKGR